jgi:hypothetical protein
LLCNSNIISFESLNNFSLWRGRAKICMDYDKVNMTPPNKELSITHWIDTEASKDVVDFLSCPLYLPTNTIISLLSKERMVGSIGNVYGSVQRMGTKYLSSDVTWEPYLKPTILDITALSPLQQLLDQPLPVSTYNFFTCEGQRDGHHNINHLRYPTCCGYFTGVQGYIYALIAASQWTRR